MLKIKENVDLKELEKFNFEYDEDNDYWFYYGFTEPNDQSEVRYYIDNKDRRISVGFDMYVNPYKILDKIYDLIQARISRKGVEYVKRYYRDIYRNSLRSIRYFI